MMLRVSHEVMSDMPVSTDRSGNNWYYGITIRKTKTSPAYYQLLSDLVCIADHFYI